MYLHTLHSLLVIQKDCPTGAHIVPRQAITFRGRVGPLNVVVGGRHAEHDHMSLIATVVAASGCALRVLFPYQYVPLLNVQLPIAPRYLSRGPS